MEVRRCVNCMEELKAGESICPHCGYDQQAREENPWGLQRGTILKGRYLVGNVLGHGGFGITYIGFDLVLSIKVAMKEYFPMGSVTRDHSGSNRLLWGTAQSSQGQRRAGCESFLKEARRMAKVDSLPEIVRVRDTFEENQTAYIVMDFVEGRTLKDRILKEGTMAFSDCLALLRPMMESLDKVHQQGLIHRDISPDNLMIQKDGSVRLLDFGAAKDMGAAPQGASQLVTKRGFSPMEQYMETGRVGPWTDVYALCATIYYCITGKLAPEAPERVMDDQLSLDVPLKEPLSKGQKEALLAGLAVRAEDRTASVGQLLEGLQGTGAGAPRQKPWQKGQTSERRPEDGAGTGGQDKRSRTGREGKKSRGRLALLLAGVAVLAAVVIGFVVRSTDPGSVERLGNSNANLLNNGGYALLLGEYQYFLDQNKDLYVCAFDKEDQCFYVDLAEKVHEEATSINVGTDWVYFQGASEDGEGVWAMHLDGSGKKLLWETDQELLLLTWALLDDGSEKLYYLESGDGEETSLLMRYDVESGEREEILDGYVLWYNLYGEYIYYVRFTGEETELCRADLKGGGSEVLDSESFYYAGFVEDGTIFLRSLAEEQAVIACDLEGKQVGGVYGLEINTGYEMLGYGNGWLYYNNASDGAVHRIRTDGSADEAVWADGFASLVCFAEDQLWIMEADMTEEGAVDTGAFLGYKDGSSLLPIGDTGGFSEEYSLEYEAEGAGIRLTAYTGESLDIILPYEIDGKEVLDYDEEMFPEDARLYVYAMEEELEYELDASGEAAILTGYTGEYTGEFPYLAVPETVGGFPVAELGEELFSGAGMTGVILPDSLQKVGEKAFFGAGNLRDVHFPEGLREIGGWAFDSCSSLTSVELPPSLEKIGFCAFWGSALNAVTIPASVEMVGSGAFGSNKGGLAAIEVEEGSGAYVSRDGVLFTADGQTLVACPVEKSGSYTVPEGVTVIGNRAFAGCVHLTEVILPQGTQEIQERAFLDCSSITRIEIPSSLAYVGSLAFQYCSSLQGLNIPEGCVYEDDAFDWAFGLLREE